jgi:hypothetical protein
MDQVLSEFQDEVLQVILSGVRKHLQMPKYL